MARPGLVAQRCLVGEVCLVALIIMWFASRGLYCDDGANELGFCYWAIETISTNHMLYKNSHTTDTLIGNLKPMCAPPDGEAMYGSSYIDTLVAPHNTEALMDVFFYCCRSWETCKQFMSASETGRQQLLLNEVHRRSVDYLSSGVGNEKEAMRLSPKNRPLQCSDKYAIQKFLPGSTACVWMVDTNSPFKAYSGAPAYGKLVSAINGKQTALNRMAKAGKLCQPKMQKGAVDGQCEQIINEEEYSVVCCCYQDPLKCAYVNKDSILWDRPAWNRKLWPYLLKEEMDLLKKFKNLAEGPDMNSDLSNWTIFRNLYAPPLGLLPSRGFVGWIADNITVEQMENTKDLRKLIADMNMGTLNEDLNGVERRKYVILCAVGKYVINGQTLPENNSEVLLKDQFAQYDEFCVSNMSLTFDANNNDRVIRAMSELGSASRELCKYGEGCRLMRSVKDLVNTKHTTASFVCCCSTENLCNHGGKKKGTVRRMIHEGSSTYACTSGAMSIMEMARPEVVGTKSDVNVLCGRAFSLDNNTDEFIYSHGVTHRSMAPDRSNTTSEGKCESIVEMPLVNQFNGKPYVSFIPVQHVRCICSVNLTNEASWKCDKDFKQKAEQLKANLTENTRPKCRHVCAHINQTNDGPHKSNITTQTTNWPICETVVELGPHGGIEVHSNAFPRVIEMLRKDSSLERKKVYRLQQSRLAFDDRYLYHQCYMRNDTPCNSVAVVKDMEIRFKKMYACRKSDARPECDTMRGDKKTCKTRLGCFIFSLGNVTIDKGCVDEVPANKEFPYLCQSRRVRSILTAQLHSAEEAVHCQGVTRASEMSGERKGMLCCCSHTCKTTGWDKPYYPY